jgi:3-methylcrotonyl-CoA carboxylase beta subunit
MGENRSFWENEELKLEERQYEATWPGGQKAVDRRARWPSIVSLQA